MAQTIKPAGKPANRPAGPPPTRAQLREAALRHLSRFSATEAGLVRVLDRRIQRWRRRAEAEGAETADAGERARAEARQVARALVEAGVIDDAAYARQRSSRLTRSGRSRRAVSADLAARGIAPEIATTAMPASRDELPAALEFARRRRIGPFRPSPGDDTRLKDLGALARAGYSRGVAEQALSTGLEQALELIEALKRAAAG